MYTKLPKTTKPTKNSFKRVLRDLRLFVTFVKKPWAVLVFSAAAMSGCASVQAKSKPADRPPLMVPPPPPRIIEPAEVIEPVGDLPNSPSGAASRAPRREAPPKPASEARPEAKAGASSEKPLEQPPVESAPVPPPVPAAQLRTPQTADTSAAARTVRTTIDTARTLLNGVSFGPLSNARKKAYNDAKLLLQQAEDAVKEGNLAFAQGLANKAETLARELAGR